VTLTTMRVASTGRHGDGVVHHGDVKIFVPHALAGDDVALELDAQGNVITSTIVQAGAAHGTPECEHFGQCGGCKMQHMNIASYAVWKHQFVAETLRDNGITPHEITAPVLSPPRSRRRATFAAVKQGKQVLLGFNQAKSHQIIDLQMCSVLRPELMALLPTLRTMLPKYMGQERTLDIRVTLLDGVLDIVVIGGPVPKLHERDMLATLAQQHNIGRISWRKWDKSPDDPIAHCLPVRAHFPHGLVELPPGGFMQATYEGELALQKAVCEAVGNATPVADLFCGIGTFALALTARAVTAIDGDGAAIAALQRAMQGRAKTNVLARNLVREPLADTELNLFMAVIIDPPRDGAKAQMQQLATSKVPVVVSVSCDLNSFCRDTKILLAGGYQLQRVTMIDQFLWSTHIELVGVFTR
jgi:23S rRNA (uracil1939-C5)-methyltransferase